MKEEGKGNDQAFQEANAKTAGLEQQGEEESQIGRGT